MLKCITFDGDASTLDTLMSYFEKLDKALADVHEVLHKETAELPVFVKEGTRIIRLKKEEILYLEGYGDYVKVHRTNGKPLLSQVSLKKFEECLTDGSFCRVHRSYIVSLPQIYYIERSVGTAPQGGCRLRNRPLIKQETSLCCLSFRPFDLQTESCRPFYCIFPPR